MKRVLGGVLPAAALATAMLAPHTARAQRLVEPRIRTTRSDALYRLASPLPVRPQAHGAQPQARVLVQPLRADTSEVGRPQGKQIVAGYMGAVLVGFLAWRAFDEPAGQHSRVDQDWGFTPRAHTAFGVGSFLGATVGVWAMGRRVGASGNLLGTAIGAAIPTVWVLRKRDDPLLPFIGALFGAPLQGIFAYAGYKATAKRAPAAK